ncbi:unnamed protein product, partial [Mesorhabditis spiculigera]
MRLETLLMAIGLFAITSAHPRGRGPRRPRWGNMTTDEVVEFKKSLRRTNVDRFHNALEKFRESKSMSQSDSDIKEFNERIKKIGQKTRSKSFRKLGNNVAEVNENVGVAENLYKGDMALTDEQVQILLGDFVDEATTETTQTTDSESKRERRQAYVDRKYPSTIWGKTFYYYFDSSLSAAGKTAAQLAIAFWQNSTCINFVQSTTAKNRVRFFKGSGCYSYIGMIGGVQNLSLGAGCESFGTAAHEIGHALGFFHTQSRLDRDAAIKVNIANVKNGWADQFDKETTSTNYNYGMPYDYGSVMHYGGESVSSNGKPTIVAKVAPYQDTMGSDFVSFYDISMMNEHYNCKATCTTGATCLNGGFRNSRSCSTCICPTGWGGATCNQRTSGCGAELTATATVKDQVVTVGDGTRQERTTAATCIYHIKAPTGMKVELTLINMLYQQCFDGCVFTGVEVKASKDHRYTGMRYCCKENSGKKIVSEGNIVPVLIYNRYYKTGVTLRYRYVPATTASTVMISQIAGSRATY